jgi:3-deoxy-D-manno-octulosonate 8-phosphate phosphatase (KDO 8-P phosphatase)
MNNIKFMVFDFDGVFTNGIIYYNDKNETFKHYNVKDGYGIFKLHRAGILVGVISGNKSNATKRICDHLNIKYMSIGNKTKTKINILNDWITELNISLDEVSYIGDDEPDRCIIEKVGYSACPNDAVDIIKNNVNYVCQKNGGEGCVREFIDLIICDDIP